MKVIPVAQLHITSTTKTELLAEVFKRVQAGEQTTIVTPYSEFLFASLNDRMVATMVNTFTYGVPDGVGLLWAHTFFKVPFYFHSYGLKVGEAIFQAAYTLLKTFVAPKFLYKDFPEKIPGSQLVWDIAEKSAAARTSIFLLGGFGDTPHKAAATLQARFPELRIAGTSNLGPMDPAAVTAVTESNADVVLVAYGPLVQERWIQKHKDEVPAKLFVGLGGTFDYLAGVHAPAPQFISRVSLEWLWRLCTQPKRIRRIWNATAGLVARSIKYKLFSTLPYRPNVVAVALDGQGSVLVGKRVAPNHPGAIEKFQSYWQLPQGGTDGEALELAALRELREETGVTSAHVLGTSRHTNRYDWPVSIQSIFSPRYRGQEQSAVFISATNVAEAVPDGREFSELRWVPAQEVSGLVHPERQPAVIPLVAEAAEMGYR